MRKVYCDKCGKEIKSKERSIVIELPDGLAGTLDLCKKHKKQFIKKLKTLVEEFEKSEKEDV